MPDESHVRLATRGKRNVDHAIASLAERQHGVVARRDLLLAGVDRNAIDRRIERRVLQVVHRGVYAFGHPALTARGVWMAAVLAAGDGAVLSHRSAAAVWGLLASGLVDVTVPSQHRPLTGVCFHRSRLPDDEVTRVDGIPVTSVPRTLIDLAAVTRFGQVERAINEAEVRRLTDPLSLPVLLERYPRRPGHHQSGAGHTAVRCRHHPK